MYRGWLLIILFLSIAGVTSADTLIVLNKSQSTASLIDLQSQKVVATVLTGREPHEVSVSPDGNFALISNYGGGRSLTMIDISQAKVVRTIALKKCQKPHGLQWLKSGRVLVTCEQRRSVMLVDLKNSNTIDEIKTSQRISHMLVVTPDEAKAFIANIGSGTVSVIDLNKKKHIKDLATGRGAEGIDLTPDGKEVWVTNRDAATVSIIDSATLEIISELKTGKFPLRVKITPDGKHALVSNAAEGSLSVFSVEEKSEIKKISIPVEKINTTGKMFSSKFGKSSVPIGIQIHPGGDTAYIAHTMADTVSIIDMKNWSLRGFLKAGIQPDGLAWSAVKVRDK